VKRGAVVAALLGVAAAGTAGWLGWRALGPAERGPVVAQTIPDRDVDPDPAPSGVETVSSSEAQPVDYGATPMNHRAAVLGLLNKRNGRAQEVTLRPGQAVRLGNIALRLAACERTAPWEVEQLTGAFVQVDVRGPDAAWKRVFSGWLYKERPALNVVQHPVYDVWTKSCATTFPDKGPDTVPLDSGAAPRRSRAPKSPSVDVPTADPGPANAVPSSASPSRTI